MNLTGADLFCGAGGTSTGILQAVASLGRRMDLLAVNHWNTAVNTHTLNHPGVRHLCETLENITPQRVIKSGRLNLLAASPECTHHSNAAGGRPKNDQSRSTAWHICRWASDLRIDNILIENVREFQNWGPLGADGKPMKSRKGETFRAFIQSLRSLGFNVEHRVLNAADFGDPTSRQRLIILARRGKPVVWPDVTHGAADLFNLKPYRTAREIIDWGHKGKSIFRRKKALSPNTLRRIAAGLTKFGGANAEPFLVILNGTSDAHINRTAKTLDAPFPTQTTSRHVGLAEPFIVTMEHQGSERSIERPLPTITTARGGAMAVVEPFLVQYHSNHKGRDDGDRRVNGLDEPLPTQTTENRFAVCEPMLLGQQSGHNGSPVSAPCPTIATSGAIGLVEPFIVKYYGNETSAESINEPLDTVTTKDRFMLVEPRTGRVVAELDILFRMLQPNELAAAMSFPKGYQFSGNRGDQVKQIGNAVPVNLARACAHALLTN